jgi:hypothetical protein
MCWRLRDWGLSACPAQPVWPFGGGAKLKPSGTLPNRLYLGINNQRSLLSLAHSLPRLYEYWRLRVACCTQNCQLCVPTFCVWPHDSLSVTNWIYTQSGGTRAPLLLPQLVFSCWRVCVRPGEKLNKTVGELLCVKNYYFRREWITRVWIAPFLVLQGVRKAISRSRPARQCE